MRVFVLLALLCLSGCNGQLVMYFVNALGDMLQRQGLKTLFTPPGQEVVDENTVNEPGTGLTGNMIMKLKQQLGNLNVSNLFAIPTVPASEINSPDPVVNKMEPVVGTKKHLMKNASGDSVELVGNVRKRYRLASLRERSEKRENSKELAEKATITETEPPRVSERRRLRPLESRLAALRPRPRPLQPGQPLIRPSPLPRQVVTLPDRPTGRVVVPDDLPSGVLRTMKGGERRPIVIVPQTSGPPGQVQSFSPGNPPPPLIPPGGPIPGDIPDLSIPFDSRPRPDGTVPADPRDVLKNETSIDEAPDVRQKQESRIRVPIKPEGRQLPPNVRPGPAVPTVPSNSNVRFLSPRPAGVPQRPVQHGINPGVPSQVGPNTNLRVFNAPIQPGQPVFVMGPNGPVQLPPGFVLTGPHGQQGQRTVQRKQPPTLQNQQGQRQRPVNIRVTPRPGPNIPLFRPIQGGNGTQSAQARQGGQAQQTQPQFNVRLNPNLQSRQPQSLQNRPLDGQVRNTVPQPSLGQPPLGFRNAQTAAGQQQQFRRPVQQFSPNNRGPPRQGLVPNQFSGQPVNLPPGFRRRFISTRGQSNPQNPHQQSQAGLQAAPQNPTNQRQRRPAQQRGWVNPNPQQGGPPQRVQNPQQPNTRQFVGPVPGQPQRRPTAFIPPPNQSQPNRSPPNRSPSRQGQTSENAPPGLNRRPVVPQPNQSARDSLQSVPRISA